MSTTPVARGPESLEAVIATVSRVAREEAAARAVPDRLVHAVAAEAVCFYWPRTVRNFIPVLALREVRAWLQYQPQYTATGTIRALSIVLAAHRFMTAE